MQNQNYKSNVLKQALIQKIHNGEYAENQRIPSCRELCRLYDLSYVTVSHVVQELCAMSLLETKPGSGTRVKASTIPNSAPSTVIFYERNSSESLWNTFTTRVPEATQELSPIFVSSPSIITSHKLLRHNPSFIYTTDDMIESMVRQDMLQPLADDLLSFLEDSLSDYPEPILRQFTFDGQLYAIPVGFSTFAFYYNKDLFDQAHLDYPNETWTWKELLGAAQVLTQRTSDKVVHFGFAPHSDVVSFLNFFLQGIPETISVDDSLRSHTHTQGMDFLAQLILQERVSPNVMESESFVTELFKTSRLAMTTAKYSMVSKLKDVPFRWGVTLMPMGHSRKTIGSVHGFGIAKDTPHTFHLGQRLGLLTGAPMQKSLLDHSMHLIPANPKYREKLPHLPAFTGEINNMEKLFLDITHNYDAIKNLILQTFNGLMSASEFVTELKHLHGHCHR